jgi:hypothetical protein
MYPAGMETNWWVRPATALARVARSLFLDALEGGGKFAPGGSSSAGRVCGLETVSSFHDDGHRRRSGPEVPILTLQRHGEAGTVTEKGSDSVDFA